MFSFQVQGEEVELTHSQEHVAFMFSLQAQGEEELQTIQENYKSVYLHPATNACALLSAGSLLQVVDEVFAGRARAGVGIIRPPATTPSRTAPTASASTTMWPSPPTGWDAKGAGGGPGCAPRQRHPAFVCGRAEGAVRVPPPP
ncbi:polyamine deacetylase HDAC10-like isoform X2 [Eriocheir sinensis]|nr:polyamine deacetylase HDAC10-like isoform X2 [Eriocheir sinensis]